MQLPNYLRSMDRTTRWKCLKSMNWVLASLMTPDELDLLSTVPWLAHGVTSKEKLPALNFR